MTWNFLRLVPVALLAVGCGSAATPADSAAFTATAYTTVTSESGNLKVELRTSSDQPPPRGTVPIELSVTDSSGARVDDLTVTVVPFMPAMGHGASVKPTVEAKGGGRYLLSNVTLFMPGRWEIRTSFTGKATDHATPTLDVQ